MKTRRFFPALIAALVATLMVVMFSSCQKSDAPDPNQIVDIDGNVYHSVVIGDQEWLVENLKVTRFNDGSPIPLIENQTIWSNLPSTKSPALCYYDNKVANKQIYGGLYNWYSVNTGKLAPEDWHVANNCDWMALINYLGGLDFAGNELKFGGFSAVFGGYRGSDKFYDIGKSTSMISADLYGDSNVLTVSAYSNAERSNYGAGGMETGLSVRCVKNKSVVVHVNK
jgi:uncharacterized protein (TIGR02145 family)